MGRQVAAADADAVMNRGDWNYSLEAVVVQTTKDLLITFSAVKGLRVATIRCRGVASVGLKKVWSWFQRATLFFSLFRRLQVN